MVSWPAGYDRIILKETDSTNAEAIRRIESFSKPTWILTELQTLGKGRRGRSWSVSYTHLTLPTTPYV